MTAPDGDATTDSEPDATLPPSGPSPWWARAAVPAAIVVVAAVFATRLHLNGHLEGDDFSLYLRQARSLFDGNPAEVVADNRFAVLNSPPGFSPIAYPWGWPLILAPFVKWWGLDFDRLKLIEVALLCVALLLLHGIVRRRTNRWIAASIMLVFALSPAYLRHTDQLLSEMPHLVAVLLVVWWIDRMSERAPSRRLPWLTASRHDLIVVGLLAAFAYNVRRESVIFLGVIAAAQAVDAVRVGWRRSGVGAVDLRRLITPHLAFVSAVVVFQLVLPAMLVPNNGGGLEYVTDRLGDAFGVYANQLGLGRNHAWGVTIAVIALCGVVVSCWRDATRHVPLAALMILTTLAVSTHFRLVDRYYLQVTPLILYFAVYAAYATGTAVASRLRRGELQARRAVTGVVCTPVLLLVPVNYLEVVDTMGDVSDYNDAGTVQWGPAHPQMIPVFQAVSEYTPPDSVLGFYRARTMTLYTDRRAIQSSSLDDHLGVVDYYAMRKGSEYSQPLLTDDVAADAGISKVWEDGTWVLWKFPDPHAATE